MTLLFFFYKNGKWLEVDDERLYRMAVGVARSKSKAKDDILCWLEKTFTEHLVGAPI